MRSLFSFLGCLIIVATGLSCNKAYETPMPLLPGLWQEQEASGQTSGFTYRIKFANDSTFRLWRHIFNDATDAGNPCNNTRTQYVQGFYMLDGDRLRLTGHYYDSSFATQIIDCGEQEFRVQHSIAGQGKNLVLDQEGGKYGSITLVPVPIQ